MANAEGWIKLINAKQWHYFVDSRSLCGRWMYLGADINLEPDDGKEHPSDCKMCSKKLKKRRNTSCH